MTVGHASLSFRSVAIQRSTEENNWSLQFTVNKLQAAETAVGLSIMKNTLGYFPLLVCVCALNVCVHVCSSATERVCICTSMFVPLNACGDVLVTPHNRHRYYRSKYSPGQRLSGFFQHLEELCFFFFFFFFFGSKNRSASSKQDSTVQKIWTLASLHTFISCCHWSTATKHISLTFWEIPSFTFFPSSFHKPDRGDLLFLSEDHSIKTENRESEENSISKAHRWRWRGCVWGLT